LLKLLDLFKNEHWRHAKSHGGNAWARITEHVLQLAEALRNNDISRAEEIAVLLKNARHNTGALMEKLIRLEKARLGRNRY